jgi:hypothetical protein
MPGSPYLDADHCGGGGGDGDGDGDVNRDGIRARSVCLDDVRSAGVFDGSLGDPGQE